MRPEDADRIRRFLRGDPGTLDEVDGWIRGASWSFRAKLGEDWEDVLQDVRLEVTRLLQDGAFRGDSSLKTYLWYVVSHACLDQLRARRRWSWTDLDDATDRLENEGLHLPAASAGHADRDLIARVLADASAECRKMWSFLLAGFSYAEMSERLEIAAGTLRVRVLRCRKKANEARRSLLEPEGETS